jgi:hypothetical protein
MSGQNRSGVEKACATSSLGRRTVDRNQRWRMRGVSSAMFRRNPHPRSAPEGDPWGYIRLITEEPNVAGTHFRTSRFPFS